MMRFAEKKLSVMKVLEIDISPLPLEEETSVPCCLLKRVLSGGEGD